MKTSELSAVLAWAKTTDLVEIDFRSGGKGFSFSAPGNPASVTSYFPGPRLVCVAAEGVGVFRWGERGEGRSACAKEGAAVSAGDSLGLVDSGLKRVSPVKSPCAGRVRHVLVDAGDPVQFGQPLFFVEPG